MARQRQRSTFLHTCVEKCRKGLSAVLLVTLVEMNEHHCQPTRELRPWQAGEEATEEEATEEEATEAAGAAVATIDVTTVLRHPVTGVGAAVTTVETIAALPNRLGPTLVQSA